MNMKVVEGIIFVISIALFFGFLTWFNNRF